MQKLTSAFAEDVAAAEATVAAWVADPSVTGTPRTEHPISHLKIALQCGGSDAFSGVSGLWTRRLRAGLPMFVSA